MNCYRTIVMVVLGVLTLAGCGSAALLPESAATIRARADTEAGILQGTWTYVHARYPLQPWPDDVYILTGDAALIAAPELRTAHVVLCSHATRFVWEGDVLWRAGCSGGCIEVVGVREIYVVLAVTTSTPEKAKDGR